MTRFVACWMAAALFSASAWAQKSSLGAGEYVTTGQYLQSPNKTYLAVQQKDGNFCIYKGSPTQYQGGALWCHNVVGPGGQFFTMVHGDGNLCTYRGTRNAGSTTWCTNAVAKGGQFLLQQQDDGNLCVIRKVQIHWPGSPPGAGPVTVQSPMWCALAGKAPQTIAIGDPTFPRRFDVSNDSSASVWVTIYGEGDYTGPKIQGTGCLEPGQKGEVHMSGYTNAQVRGEQTQSPHCQQPVACDTSVQEAGGYPYHWQSVIFRRAGNCWWDFAP